MTTLDLLTGLAICVAGISAMVLALDPMRTAVLWMLDRVLWATRRKGRTTRNSAKESVALAKTRQRCASVWRTSGTCATSMQHCRFSSGWKKRVRIDGERRAA